MDIGRTRGPDISSGETAIMAAADTTPPSAGKAAEEQHERPPHDMLGSQHQTAEIGDIEPQQQQQRRADSAPARCQSR